MIGAQDGLWRRREGSAITFTVWWAALCSIAMIGAKDGLW
jgi:hypothetical protein